MALAKNQNSKKEKEKIKPEPDYIKLTEAAGFSPYSQEYLSLLARNGKIDAKKFGRNWYITKKAIDDYLTKQGLKIILPKNLFNASYKGKINQPLDFFSISEPSFQKEPKTIFASLGERPFEEEPTEEEEKKEFPKQTIRAMRKDIMKLKEEEKGKVEVEKVEKVEKAEATVVAKELNMEELLSSWTDIISAVKTASVRMSLKDAIIESLDEDCITLGFSSNFHRKKVEETAACREVEDVIKDNFHHVVSLKCILQGEGSESSALRQQDEEEVNVVEAVAEIFGK